MRACCPIVRMLVEHVVVVSRRASRPCSCSWPARFASETCRAGGRPARAASTLLQPRLAGCRGGLAAESPGYGIRPLHRRPYGLQPERGFPLYLLACLYTIACFLQSRCTCCTCFAIYFGFISTRACCAVALLADLLVVARRGGCFEFGVCFSRCFQSLLAFYMGTFNQDT